MSPEGFSPGIVVVLGFSIVFIGLLLIILLTKLMSAIIGAATKGKKKQPAVAIAKAAAASEPVPAAGFAPIADRGKLDAVVAAVIATYMGGDVQGLRIRSLKQVSAPPAAGRQQFVAVLSAAIASAMGTEVSGLRIHKITKL